MHYSDPEARMKLRQYLSSPQKFDEAVEFGFPSTDKTSEPSTPTVAESTETSFTPLELSHDLQTFLRDDWLSFLDSDKGIENNERDVSDDEDSLEDPTSPVTPPAPSSTFATTCRPTLSQKSTSRCASSEPPILPKRPDLLNLAGSREMTLRMTLTRPDLRANEETLYGWQAQHTTAHARSSTSQDPLALEDLKISDDMTGQNGAFAVREKRRSVMKKLVKKKK
ncbi:hypothetical protein LTS18_005861 [Coniosporium uncinatum]|uniref:Uncharacterized protein n=1 Tax=Coniosporium uncinatum TaxID=93489 RepID=A0ACC3D4G1_9PEZI|nr:hypothetical protein LTS18_005861 [Coniosporium uncinatum]